MTMKAWSTLLAPLPLAPGVAAQIEPGRVYSGGEQISEPQLGLRLTIPAGRRSGDRRRTVVGHRRRAERNADAGLGQRGAFDVRARVRLRSDRLYVDGERMLRGANERCG